MIRASGVIEGSSSRRLGSGREVEGLIRSASGRSGGRERTG